jgi:SAM-dependent methyltransferase
MHLSSLLKARLFVETYAGRGPAAAGRRRVLEVGSKSYDAQQTYRPLFPPEAFDYVGLDVEPGPNVDVVPAAGYVWDEIGDDSFDLCVSGQTFEHNPFFWVTFGEIGRILKPGGHAFICAPGAGSVHRFPYDCWRFYPDAWRALAALTGLELVESWFESDAAAEAMPGGMWRDSCAIVRKPAGDAAALNDRLRALAAPHRGRGFALPDLPPPGPAFGAYAAKAAEAGTPGFGARARRGWKAFRRGVRLFDGAE